MDFVTIVKKLGKLLKKNRFFCDIVPIHSAKVPIVKLRHRPTGLESDISVYNQLGRRNSLLLATYCAIDSRVRVRRIVSILSLIDLLTICVVFLVRFWGT